MLAHRWRVDASELIYSPVGAGSYHWTATDAGGERCFVTLDDLDSKPWLGRDRETVYEALRRCYETALRLRHEAALEFVVAPTRCATKSIIERLTDRFSIAVFPFVAGHGIGHFQTPQQAKDEIVALLVRLHAAGDCVKDLPPTRRLEIPSRAALENALAQSHQTWSGGPHAEEARAWLEANQEPIEQSLRAYDALAEQISTTAVHVITHGEPHAGNFMRVNGGLALVDWDTVAFAPPERDLWLCCRNDPDAADLYTRATGRVVDPAAIRLFTTGWELTDIALYVDQLRSEHADSEDSRRAINVLRRTNVAALA